MPANQQSYQEGHAMGRALTRVAVLGLRGLIIAILGSISLMARVRPEAFMLGAKD